MSVTTIKRPKNDEVVNVVVLADKPVNRMTTYGPKPLLTYKNLPVYQHQLSSIYRVYPDARVTYVVGYQKEAVIANMPKSVRIVENPHYENESEIEPIRLGFNSVDTKKVIFIPGQNIFDNRVLDGLTVQSSLVYGDFDKGMVGVLPVSDKVANFSYKHEQKFSGIFSIVENFDAFDQLINFYKKNSLLHEMLEKNFYPLHAIKNMGNMTIIKTHKDLV